jgi:predicted ArsR family transcriptional regulator
MTPANIRYHLRNLSKDHLVEDAGQRGSQSGRPAKVYRLSPEGVQLEPLTRALLRSIATTERGQESLVKALANTQLGRETSASLRFYEAMPHLNTLGYEAHWEARAGGPEIIFGNCPYAAILADHPELCQMDADLLSTMLDQPVRQTEKLVPGKLGLPVCRFITRQD